MTTNNPHIPNMEIDMEKAIQPHKKIGLIEMAFWKWIREGDIEGVRLCIKNTGGKIVNFSYLPRHYSPLMVACGKNKLDIVKLLVENGADIDAQDIDGTSPLLGSCDCGYLEIVEYLLKKGANPNTKNKLLWTPIRIAIHKTDVEMLRLLRKYGAQDDFVDWEIAEKERRKMKKNKGLKNSSYFFITFHG